MLEQILWNNFINYLPLNKKLKIGIVCYPTYGGSGVVATELGASLALKGHEVHFISYAQPFRLNLFSKNTYFHEVNIPDYPLFEYAPYELNLTSKLVDVVLHEKLNILHVHYAIPHASAAISAKNILNTYGINLPIVTTLHGTDITLFGKDPSFKPVIEYSINKSDAVTAVSQSLINETNKIFNISKKINLVPNFIDLKLYSNCEDNNLRSSIVNDEKIIIHVSNFRKVKRVIDVIKIFNLITKKVPSKLLMIGDGPERIKAEKLSRKLNINHQIKFLGKLKSVEQYLSISDLFILPSESESFGLVALEAMASGVPVISTDVGGISEVNINNQTGFTFNVGDINDMASQSINLLIDIDKLKRFKQTAISHAKNFDLPIVLPKYEELYSKILK